MLLPTSTPEGVTRFRKTCLERYSADLSATDAQTKLTRLVQFWYLMGGHEAYKLRVACVESISNKPP